jgi:hypothetical protein
MALGAGEMEVEQFEAADTAVADVDGQPSGGVKGAHIHLASSHAVTSLAYQRFKADANRALPGLCC